MTEEIKESDLLFMPEPQRPPDFDCRFANIVGINADTGEAPLRIVWGPTHRKWFQGKNEIHYIDPNGVFLGIPCYVLEAWSPPSVYDRQEWEDSRWGAPNGHWTVSRCSEARPEPCTDPYHFARIGMHEVWDMTIDALGPFPEKGVWDMLCFIRSDEGSFFENALAKAREWRHNATRPNANARAIEDYTEFMRKREVWRAKAHEELRERLRLELEAAMDVDVSQAKDGFSIGPNAGRRHDPNRILLGDNNAVPANATVITPSGLIVKRSAVEGN